MGAGSGLPSVWLAGVSGCINISEGRISSVKQRTASSIRIYDL